VEHLSPKEAYRFLQENPSALFIDTRSEAEFMFVGHAVGSLVVPLYDGEDWEKNPHFVAQVKKLAGSAGNDRPIVLICRSGNRTLEAGEMLESVGFTRVINVLHGFEGSLDDHHHRSTLNGWRFDNLPWQQY
jgi:rhodanese-related sulfurtransferase